MTDIYLPNIHLFFNKSRRDSNTYTPSKKRTSVVKDSFLSRNEVKIANRLQKIPNGSSFFHYLEDVEVLSVQEESESDSESESESEVQVGYLLFMYQALPLVDLTDFMYACKSIRQVVLYATDSLHHVLSGISLLRKHKLCFLNVCPSNIVFLREKARLTHLEHCISTDASDRVVQLLHTISDFTYMPFELHLLYVLTRDGGDQPEVLSSTFMEEFCHAYVDQLGVFRLFSPTFKHNYWKLCMEQMEHYKDKPVPWIVQHIVERIDQCDAFNVSLVYIYIFGCIIKVCSLKDTFMNKIVSSFLINLHPDGAKRMTVEESIHTLSKCLEDKKYLQFDLREDVNALFQELSM